MNVLSKKRLQPKSKAFKRLFLIWAKHAKKHLQIVKFRTFPELAHDKGHLPGK